MQIIGGKQQKLLLEHTFDIGKFQYYENIIVGEFYEGVHVTFENAIEPITMAKELYRNNEPLVYVSHRLHSYSMDPMGYRKTMNMFPNFHGFAIVSTNKYRRMLVSLEKLFIPKPTAVFYELSAAFDWAEQLLARDRVLYSSL